MLTITIPGTEIRKTNSFLYKVKRLFEVDFAEYIRKMRRTLQVLGARTVNIYNCLDTDQGFRGTKVNLLRRGGNTNKTDCRTRRKILNGKADN